MSWPTTGGSGSIPHSVSGNVHMLVERGLPSIYSVEIAKDHYYTDHSTYDHNLS